MKPLPLVLAALALAAFVPLAPTAAASPCPMGPGCPPPPIWCQPITDCVILACDVLPSASVDPWVSFTGTSCFGGDLTVCSGVTYQNPVSPKPGRVVCTQETTLVVP
jgi:hypothetical protein